MLRPAQAPEPYSKGCRTQSAKGKPPSVLPEGGCPPALLLLLLLRCEEEEEEEGEGGALLPEPAELLLLLLLGEEGGALDREAGATGRLWPASGSSMALLLLLPVLPRGGCSAAAAAALPPALPGSPPKNWRPWRQGSMSMGRAEPAPGAGARASSQNPAAALRAGPSQAGSPPLPAAAGCCCCPGCASRAASSSDSLWLLES